MAYRKRTLRTMRPQTRKLAKLIGELEGLTRRLKNYLEVVAELEVAGVVENPGRRGGRDPQEDRVYPLPGSQVRRVECLDEDTEEREGHLDGLASLVDGVGASGKIVIEEG